ncbi:MAG: hypothetical protein Q7K65_05960 [Candidatus Buchananbacteria bacterium]|nr:hypothetical protein [Candidatus Buchananbacteria bacterium]
MSEKAVEIKYILFRREIDGFNEVIKAGPKAPSATGLVDFKTFIKEHGLHHLELAQLLKVSLHDIQLLLDHDSWIEQHAKDNLLLLIRTTCSRGRHELCKFLMAQEGNVGSKNIPVKKVDLNPVTLPK